MCNGLVFTDSSPIIDDSEVESIANYKVGFGPSIRECHPIVNAIHSQSISSLGNQRCHWAEPACGFRNFRVASAVV
jgi:hypothetical protein